MSQLSKVLRSLDNDVLAYWCQGCKSLHSVRTGTNGWGYNGNPEKPTFTPSVKVTSGHYSSRHKEGDSCWCTYNKENPGDDNFVCVLCHTFITDGKVQFLSDCTHELAGQTLNLPELPAYLQDPVQDART